MSPSVAEVPVGLPPRVWMLQEDLDAAGARALLGSEAVVTRRGQLALLPADRLVEATSKPSPTFAEIPPRVELNRQLAFIASRDYTNHLTRKHTSIRVHNSSLRGPLELRVEGPQEGWTIRRPPDLKVGTGFIASVLHTTGALLGLIGPGRSPRVTLVEVEGVGGPPGSVRGMWIGQRRDAFKLRVRTLPWTRVVVHHQQDSGPQLLYVSRRTELLRAIPPFVTGAPQNERPAPFEYAVYCGFERAPENSDTVTLIATLLDERAGGVPEAAQHSAEAWLDFARTVPSHWIRQIEASIRTPSASAR